MALQKRAFTLHAKVSTSLWNKESVIRYTQYFKFQMELKCIIIILCEPLSPQISNQCGSRIVGYEILYYQLKNSPNNETAYFAPDISSDQTKVSYTIHHLKPYTEYSVQIRTVAQVSGGSQQLVSNFSLPQVFVTPEGGM